MYINRIVLRDVRSISELDIELRNQWTDAPLSSVLFTGINGSGKTTILRAIAALWEAFGYWLEGKPLTKRLQNQVQNGILTESNWLAIEIREFPDLLVPPQSLWLVISKSIHELDVFRLNIDYSSNLVIGEVHQQQKTEFYFASLRNNNNWLEHMHNQKTRQELTGEFIENPLPNLLFLPIERNLASQTQNRKLGVYTEPVYRWFLSIEKRGEDIEELLKNQKVRNPQVFYEIIEGINGLLSGKRITDFDQNTRLQVEVNSNGRSAHYIDKLSSGEIQCLLLWTTVSRWLAPRGIVLIDEPDLHLHVSLQRHFIHELEKLVLSKNGQLIVASHSPELWEEYSERQRIDLTAEVKHG